MSNSTNSIGSAAHALKAGALFSGHSSAPPLCAAIAVMSFLPVQSDSNHGFIL